MRQGQLFSSDLAISIMVFLTMVGTVMLAAGQTFDGDAELRELEKMRQKANQIASLAVISTGYPDNWTVDTARVIGFANKPHVLDSEKLGRFGTASYTVKKDLLDAHPYEFSLRIMNQSGPLQFLYGGQGGGVGDEPVALVVEESTDFSQTDFVSVLNGSAVEWDLYWPSSADEDMLESLTARTVYNYTENGQVIFDDLIVNASSQNYSTVLAEDVNLDADTIAENDALVTFVEEGGTFLHSREDPTLIKDTFGFDSVSVGSGNGSILRVEPLINASYSVGDYIEFENEHMAFESVDEIFVEDTASPYGCLACLWTVGEGKVYYVADTLQEAGDDLTVFEEATDGFRFTMNSSFGREPGSDAKQITASQRSVLLNTSEAKERGNMEVVLWR